MLVGEEFRAALPRVLRGLPPGLASRNPASESKATPTAGGSTCALQRVVGHSVEQNDDGHELRAAGLAL